MEKQVPSEITDSFPVRYKQGDDIYEGTIAKIKTKNKEDIIKIDLKERLEPLEWSCEFTMNYLGILHYETRYKLEIINGYRKSLFFYKTIF